jgi:hypothetical protein
VKVAVINRRERAHVRGAQGEKGDEERPHAERQALYLRARQQKSRVRGAPCRVVHLFPAWCRGVVGVHVSKWASIALLRIDV